MATIDSGKHGSKKTMLSRKSTAGDTLPLSYGAASRAGPSTGGVTYEHAASHSPIAQEPTPIPFPTQSSHQGGVNLNEAEPPKEPTWKRFLKAFGVAILVWVLLCMLAASIADRGVPRVVDRLGPPTSPGAADGIVKKCYPHSSDDDHHHNAKGWNDRRLGGPRSLSAHIELGKAQNEALYLLTRGDSALGSVTFQEERSGDAFVGVTVHHDRPMQPVDNMWQVCMLERGDERGIGIYFPDYEQSSRLRRHYFDVEVTVALPKYVGKFSTDARNYAHVFASAENTTFNSLAIRTANARVEAKTPVTASELNVWTTNGPILGSYTGTTIALSTTNAPISGRFWASSWLSLQTSNGAIDLTATVGHALAISTINAPIRGAISFFGSSDAIDATLATVNGEIAVRVPRLPTGTALSLNAHTSNASAFLTLPASFEGSIRQTTSKGWGTVLVMDGDLRDPSGRGRDHVVTKVEDENGRSEHRVGWGHDHGAGDVRLWTSNESTLVAIAQDP